MSIGPLTAPRKERVVTLQLPRKLGFLLEMHPYKVAYGGRSSLKSHSFAAALLTLGIDQGLRIICAREVQKSLADSVHQLLVDKIDALGYNDLYSIQENVIRGTRKDTTFKFIGLSDVTIQNVKSIEGTDILWVEEAQNVKKRSWQTVLPTLFRTPNAECWVSFNPDMDDDETYTRFVVNAPDGAVVVEMNWRDAVKCGWFASEQEKLRQYDLKHAPLDYPNIWDGKPRTVVAGAIYTTEVTDMVREKRFRPMPYDPRLPVHRIWDLGWNDLMTVIMVQKPAPSVLNVINYLEDNQLTYAEMIGTMKDLRYVWGNDWLPHDATQHHPTSGTNARKQLHGLGCKVKDIPRSDPEARIRAARMMWPRIYMDNSKFDTPPERPDMKLGAGNLMERLKRYKRAVPKGTMEPAAPVHNNDSHGADAYGGLAEIVDQIRNEGEVVFKPLPSFRNADPSMGMLG